MYIVLYHGTHEVLTLMLRDLSHFQTYSSRRKDLKIEMLCKDTDCRGIKNLSVITGWLSIHTLFYIITSTETFELLN